MKFYVISDLHGAVIGCERSLQAAKEYGRNIAGMGQYEVDLVTIGRPAETIRRLLGNLGGYAGEFTRVWPKPEA